MASWPEQGAELPASRARVCSKFEIWLGGQEFRIKTNVRKEIGQ
jgi:hypothetical protein